MVYFSGISYKQRQVMPNVIFIILCYVRIQEILLIEIYLDFMVKPKPETRSHINYIHSPNSVTIFLIGLKIKP